MAGRQLTVAVLDDYADTSRQHFGRVPGVTVDRFPETLDAGKPEGLEALVQRLQGYEVISSMRERTAFPAALQRRLPRLKLLMTTGPRNASIDLAAAARQHIVVTGTTGARAARWDGDGGEGEGGGDERPRPARGDAVVQHAWALLLALCGRVAHDDRALKTRPTAWQSSMAMALAGKTLGLVGLGRLGAMMGRTAVAGFGMQVVAWSENLSQARADAAAEGVGLAKGTFRVVGKEHLFARADVVSLHLVLSDRSRGVVGPRELGSMKKSAVLLNTSRGGLIDEQALVRALTERAIEGFATDVFWEEPLGAESIWRKADEWAKSAVVMSPHMGYVNAGTMNSWYDEQADIVEKYMKGEELPNRLN